MKVLILGLVLVCGCVWADDCPYPGGCGGCPYPTGCGGSGYPLMEVVK